MHDYEALLGMEFMKKYEAMIILHLKKQYIYNGREYVPLSVPTMASMMGEHKITTMSVEEIKQDGEICERLDCMETRLMQHAKIIQTLSDSVFGLIGKLEAIEDCKDENKGTLPQEALEAYMRRFEEEYIDTWIEVLDEDEGGKPSTFPTPPFSRLIWRMGSLSLTHDNETL